MMNLLRDLYSKFFHWLGGFCEECHQPHGYTQDCESCRKFNSDMQGFQQRRHFDDAT